MTTTTEPTTPDTKIVIAAGTEFSVPATTDNEAIRQQLLTMGFADVASATIQTGTKRVGDVTYPTIEFVKKAGTKGLDGADLAALLGRLAPVSIERAALWPALTFQQRWALRRLLAGEYTIGEALIDHERVAAAIDSAMLAAQPEFRSASSQEGAALCQRIDALGAVAAPSRPSGW